MDKLFRATRGKKLSMKKWSLWCILLIMISFVSACGDSNPSCTSNCTSTTNVTFNYTLEIVFALLDARITGKGPLIISLSPKGSSAQFKVDLTKVKSLEESVKAQVSNTPFSRATYALGTQDPDYSCVKKETPQIGRSPKYSGLFVVEYRECGKLVLPSSTPTTTTSNNALLVMFTFPPPPCQTLQDGLLLCFPKP